ncbi:terpene synthase family protein [Lentzea jiangxiensis]|uniref:terpene synthase family protein n=1 Tax=Lentzea jiangxiensis TaxID=641025 RepID=UPI00115F8272|nr:hypothetical protein [Lentzea jiangxiensis]
MIEGEASERAIVRMGYGRCAAYTFSEASIDDLLLCTEWLVWIFALDDRHAHHLHHGGTQWQSFARRISAAVDGTMPEVEPDPLVRATRDLCARTFARTSSRMRTRIVDHIAKLLAGFRRETYYQRDNLPGVDDFISTRRLNAGMYLFCDLLELVERADLPEAVHRSTEYQMLLDGATDVGAWQNDMLSLSKEEVRGEVSNLVLVVQHAASLNRTEAMEDVAVRIRGRIADFDLAEAAVPAMLAGEDLPAGTRQAVERCAQGLRQWVNGFLMWSLDTGRYGAEVSTAFAVAH